MCGCYERKAHTLKRESLREINFLKSKKVTISLSTFSHLNHFICETTCCLCVGDGHHDGHRGPDDHPGVQHLLPVS